MKLRNIIIAYDYNQGLKICYENNLNINDTILFLHQNKYSVTHKLNYQRKFVPVDNPDFMRLLEKLRGFSGEYTFYFDNYVSYTYSTENLCDDLYLVFSLNPLMDLSVFDKPIQELYQIIRKDCE